MKLDHCPNHCLCTYFTQAEQLPAPYTGQGNFWEMQQEAVAPLLSARSFAAWPKLH